MNGTYPLTSKLSSQFGALTTLDGKDSGGLTRECLHVTKFHSRNMSLQTEFAANQIPTTKGAELIAFRVNGFEPQTQELKYHYSFKLYSEEKSQSPILHQFTRSLSHIMSHEMETVNYGIEMEKQGIALTVGKSSDTESSFSPRTSTESSSPTPTFDRRR